MSQIDLLLADLKNADENIRHRATVALWRLWFHQKGAYGMELLQQAQALLENGDTKESEVLLTSLIEDQPDFAEAWNRRAIFYYSQGKYQKSLEDCQMVVSLNPYHFGAFHGLGLCHAALGAYGSAIRAFRQALELQPYATINQKLILECTIHLT
jgi:tetratricopeptide (TPR) repeat protein